MIPTWWLAAVNICAEKFLPNIPTLFLPSMTIWRNLCCSCNLWVEFFRIINYLWHRIIAGCCDPGMFLMFSLYTLSQNRTKCFDKPPCMTLDTWTKHVMRVFAKCWQSVVFIRQMRRVWSWTPHLRHGHCIHCQSTKINKSSKHDEMFENARFWQHEHTMHFVTLVMAHIRKRSKLHIVSSM